MIKEISLIGSGSWATALAKIFTDGGLHLKWWVRGRDTRNSLTARGVNPKYLSAVHFDRNKISVTQDFKDLDTEFMVVATPSVFVHRTLEPITDTLHDRVIFSSVKGMVPETDQVLGDYLQDRFHLSSDRTGVITGPCHAEEVAMERLSYLTVSCGNTPSAVALAEAMRSEHIRTIVSQDVLGSEYAAVLKNVYAICSGICHGLGYGDNFQAVLISNAMREMQAFVAAVAPAERDINHSAYLGDLLVTAYSTFSRNRTFGNMIGKGYTIQSTKMQMQMVAEGYYGVRGVVHLLEQRKLSVNMPILRAVYEILYEEAPVPETLKTLAKSID